MNTCINYLYRDACNYKCFNRCVINGQLTEEQEKTIQNCLDGDTFIPQLVGLPEERLGAYGEDDHPFFELVSFEPVNASFDVDITPENLVALFQKYAGRWEKEGLQIDAMLRYGCMNECESDTCAFNRDGVCMFKAVFGIEPAFTEDGCDGWVLKPERYKHK